jgi:prepilin-type N-terminal cleavage/methylation domain-containing protein
MNRSRGFTLVELVLALAIMSLAFTVLTSGILDLYHRYQSGLAIRTTQQNARAIANQVTNDVRSNAYVIANPGVNAICMFSTKEKSAPGGVMYYVSGGAAPHELIRRTFASLPWSAASGCNLGVAALSQQALSDNNVSVLQFSENASSDPAVPEIDLVLASTYDLQDVSTSPPYQCPSGLNSPFCSVTTLDITTQAARAQ